jgi:hypothetical protein
MRCLEAAEDDTTWQQLAGIFCQTAHPVIPSPDCNPEKYRALEGKLLTALTQDYQVNVTGFTT